MRYRRKAADASPLLRIERGSLIAVGPERVTRQRDRRVGPDLVARRGAEFEHLQSVAEQIDVVDVLRALIAAIEDARAIGVAAVVLSDRDILRAQCDAYVFAGPD